MEERKAERRLGLLTFNKKKERKVWVCGGRHIYLGGESVGEEGIKGG